MTTFPADPPALLEDAETIKAHDWQAYQQLNQMENHWNRPGWKSGRRSYHWMLRFANAENVRQIARHCQVQLQFPELDLVPLDTLHVTIGRLGFTEEMTAAEARAVANEARGASEALAPFPLTIGPLAGSKGAVRFSLCPWTELVELHRYLTNATRAIRGDRCPMDTRQFRPHLSIAYANTTLPIVSILPRIEQLRTLPTEASVVTSVELVELRREERTYRFDVLDSLQLGA